VSGTPRGHLRLKIVGRSRLDIAAVGTFDREAIADVSARLDRLVAGGPGCICIDCSQVAAIEPEFAGVLARVRDLLQAIGGQLEISDAPPNLRHALAASAVLLSPDGGTIEQPAAVAS
jgi:anti-anti-sigma regulatory factor